MKKKLKNIAIGFLIGGASLTLLGAVMFAFGLSGYSQSLAALTIFFLTVGQLAFIVPVVILFILLIKRLAQ
ncbi:MAG TPA: hypothetical protein PKC76_12800 [Saprospiraceae bacterium]|nr:hypothetical protein [Saprospiraceae bacterium]HMP25009.1 hypothetical protein [Saprospiraceae bacterium]